MEVENGYMLKGNYYWRDPFLTSMIMRDVQIHCFDSRCCFFLFNCVFDYTSVQTIATSPKVTPNRGLVGE